MSVCQGKNEIGTREAGRSSSQGLTRPDFARSAGAASPSPLYSYGAPLLKRTTEGMKFRTPGQTFSSLHTSDHLVAISP